MALLELDDLAVEYRTERGPLRAVDQASFDLEEGETLGIVGESGCGKTTLSKAILRLLPQNGRIAEGEIAFKGTDLATIPKDELNDLRWNEISYIVQNAMNALDPVYTVQNQLVEVIRHHTDVSKAEARSRAEELVEGVGLDAARLRDYPHELSGGQRQRVVIALALALDPSLIIADECTTGLDVIVQDEILELISDIQTEIGSSMIFVSHDISAVAEVSDRIAVMYGGRIAEIGPAAEVLKRGAHPYTLGLVNAFPPLEPDPQELVSIPGTPPNLVDPEPGCRFAERCPFATEECQKAPPMFDIDEEHRVRCHYPDRREEFQDLTRKPETWRPDLGVETR